MTTQAAKTAKGVTTQATKTAKGVTTQATKTAGRARAAAKSVTPTRRPTTKTPTKTAKTAKNGQGRQEAELHHHGRQEDDRQKVDRRQEGRQLSPGARRRLDTELVRRGLVPTRQEARAAVSAGNVLVAGAPADKVARMVAPDEPIVLLGPPAPFVSRGGQKLDAALTRFAVPVAGRHALDAGASTGGFTDCLLQRGAVHVYAVDVGHGQLDPRLRADGRVTVLERVNARRLTVAVLRGADPAYEPCPLVVADLSFISLRTVVPALCGPVCAVGGDLVLLVKPQFEAGRAAVSRGRGVVRDPQDWFGALVGVASALDDAGTGIMGAMASPLIGPAGNVEFLVHARKGVPGPSPDRVAALLGAAVSEAEGHPFPPGSAD